GTYNATLTVTDNSGATDTASTTITVNTTTSTYSLSGNITSANNISVDSDLNDPQAPYATNDQAEDAQALSNPVMVNGFVSESPSGVTGDRFETTSDMNDIYRTSLYAGQYVSLRVANFDDTAPTTNDVDILLYDNNLNLVAESQSQTEFESIAVPSDGEYYIQVTANSGLNKYVLSIGSTSLASTQDARGWTADFALDQAIIDRRSELVSRQSIEALSQLSGVRLSHDSTKRLSLLHLDPEVSTKALLRALKGDEQALETETWYESLPQETRRKIDTLSLIKQLNQQSGIVSAIPNFKYHATLEPNDTYFSYQMHYQQIRLSQAWDITTGTPDSGNVIVAVVDSGLAMDHDDFDGQLVDGYDFVSDSETSNDGDGIDNYPNDPGSSTNPGESTFHGTHVAGTIAAASNNSLGVTGVSWGAKIMPLRALGLGNQGTSYDIVQAIRYAVGLSNDSNTLPSQTADIINLSLAGSGYDQALQDLFTQVHDSGVIVVAAAGNSNTSVLFYPASYDDVISVSAMDWQNNKAPYSNYGSKIDVGAPGGNVQVDTNGDGYGDGVLSCVINDSSGDRISNYAFYHGTSMASPHIAGVIALMKAIYPDLTPTEFDTLLANGDLTEDLGDSGRDDIYGYGMIDALKAVEAAQKAAGSTPLNTVTATPTSFDFGASSQSTTITLTGQGTMPPSITGFNSSKNWLSVTAGTIDTNGLGEYILTVDRSGLVDATYTATVDFSLSDGKTISIAISMQVLTESTDNTGNAGFLYLVLFDTSQNKLKQLNLSPTNGSYPYQLDDVAAGDYYLIAGSDIDNDGNICEVGESCGAYPLHNEAEIVTVDRNHSGLDFSATINSGFSNMGSTNLSLPLEGISIKNSTTDQP
ncbi:MAG: S8 family peptidase, partial [Chromatiales bacterium]